MTPSDYPIDLPLRKVNSGKVREIYDAGDDNLLIVTSDRLSAFDVILNDPIPGKGKCSTACPSSGLSIFRGV